jgi:hypothetical protein
VVHDQAGAVGRELDIELDEQGDKRARGGDARAKGDEDVAVGIHEVDEDVGGQVRAETLLLSAARAIGHLGKPLLPFDLVGKRMTWS